MTLAAAERAHSPLSASAAERWINCPGSVRLAAQCENKSSSYALEGTTAHAVAQHCLDDRQDPSEFLGHYYEPKDGRFYAHAGTGRVEVTSEMTDAVQVYLDAIEAEVSHQDDELDTEVRLDLSQIHPGMFGTADACIYRPSTQHLTVADYKHGQGVPVDVLENKQLLYYAVGRVLSLRNRGVKTVKLLVVQPRCFHKDGPVRAVTVDVVDLLDFIDDLKKAALRTEEPDAPLVPGAEWCKWCPAAGSCPALHDKALAIAQAEFSATGEATPADVMLLPAAQLPQLLREAALLEQWIKAVRNRAMDAARQNGLEGYKLVATLGHRRWQDEAAAVETLELMGYDREVVMTQPKLLSPAQVEKAIKAKKADKKLIAELTVRPTSGVSLVPESDPREPVMPDAAAQFEAVE